MFHQFAKAFKSSQAQELLSTIDKTDFEFFGKVVRWVDQDLNKKLPTRYQFADNNDRWRVDTTAEDNNTTWLLRHYN